MAGPTTFERRVISGADDVEQRTSGSMAIASSDLELVDDLGTSGGAAQIVGIRFTGVNIPQGAVITSAYLQFQVDEVGSSAASLLVRGNDADDAAAFTTAKNDVSARAMTDASAMWTPPAWPTVGQAGLAQRTPDLSSIVQEVVARPGWAAGNDMALVITGTGTRTAEAFEGSAAGAPLLHIEWAAGAPDTVAPTVSMNAPAEGSTVSGTIQLSAIAGDDVAVQGVQFRVDSESVGNLDTSAPYAVDLDTALLPNGTVALSAVATDTSGNQTVSAPITITIDNSAPPPPPPPPSGTIRVPEDFATIQEAVNAAGSGDTILVGPGTYAGGIVISGKSITLTSRYQADGDPNLVDQTIINGGAPAISIESSAPNTAIKGFHFEGGSKSVQFFGQGGQCLDNFFDHTGGDAVSFENTGGVARGNRIVHPGDDGIDVDDARSDVLIERNTIQLAGDDGIEIRNQNYAGPLVTMTMRDNTIVGSAEDGIQLIDYSAQSSRQFVIERNLIRTSAAAGLGLMDNGETIEDFRAASMPERVEVFNNTLDGNSYGITGGDNLIALNNIISNSSVLGLKNIDGTSTVAYTLFFGNGVDSVGSNVDAATTLTADPLYTSAFELQAGSPAIDSGTVSFVHNMETVLTIPASEYNGASADLGWLEGTSAPPNGAPPLFTGGADVVDFNQILAGGYEAGSQYNALAGDDAVTLPADAAAATAAGYDRARFFHGGDGNDTIAGGTLNDAINGDAGDDTLTGDAGIDRLFGDSGHDTLKWDNADSFDGGVGFDTLDANLSSADAIDLRGSGFANLERIVTGGGDDAVALSLNRVLSDTADRQLVADLGSGTDTLSIDLAGGWVDTTPNPTLGPTGVAAGVSVDGMTAYTFTNGTNTATLFSDAETVQVISAAAPLFTAGNDAVDFSRVVAGGYLAGSQYDALAGDDTVTLPADAAAAAAAGYSVGQPFQGGDGNDVIAGRNLDDAIGGGIGDDILRGGFGNDTLNGGNDTDVLAGAAGNDTLDGGPGTDAADYGAAPAAVTVDLNLGTATGEGSDKILNVEDVTGSAFNDRITANAGSNILRGGGGNDTLQGGDGSDALSGGGGKDALLGQAGDDTLTGGDGNDTLTGGAGLDKLSGDAGHDTLKWDKFDSFDGGLGFDTLDANLSSGDTVDLRGPNSANLERIRTGGGRDTVTLSLNDVLSDTADDQFVADLGSGSPDTLNIDFAGGWTAGASNPALGPTGISAGISVAGMTAYTFANGADIVTVFSNAEIVHAQVLP